jgi:hypothetical protein
MAITAARMGRMRVVARATLATAVTDLVEQLLRERDPDLEARVQRALFHTDADGEEAIFVDVMADSADGRLDDRIPALRLLLERGSADERLSAAMLLIAADDQLALRELIRWTTLPDDVPWGGVNRFTGEDTTFGWLADALAHGGDTARAAAALPVRIQATRGLLRLAAHHDCERDLGHLLIRADTIRPAVRDDIAAAAEESITLLEQRHRPRFDLWTQAAGLLAGLAIEDDARAAGFARRLIKQGQRDRRMLLELVDSMAAGRGPQSRAVLRELSRSRLREVSRARPERTYIYRFT